MWTRHNNGTFLSLTQRVSFALLVAFWLSECEAFSSFPMRHLEDGGHSYDSEEFFFVDRQGRRDSTRGQVPIVNHRQRFSVQYNPATPRPPLHPPSWSTLESAESKASANSSLGPMSMSMDATSVLAGVASGLWTVAPVLYLHCVNQSMLSFFPMMLLIAALEVAMMVMAHYQFDDSQTIVASFVALRVSTRYLFWVPLNLPFEVLESIILFGSSSLALHSFAVPDETQTAPILPKENPRTKRKPPTNFQRGIQW